MESCITLNTSSFTLSLMAKANTNQQLPKDDDNLETKLDWIICTMASFKNVITTNNNKLTNTSTNISELIHHQDKHVYK